MADTPVAAALRRRIAALTPAEKKLLGESVTPELAAVFAKIFGRKAADILDRADQLKNDRYRAE